MSESVDAIGAEELEEIKEDVLSNDDISVEALALLLNTQRIRQLEEQTKKELKDLKARQDQVRFLHKLQKAINSTMKDDGSIDWSNEPDLLALLDKARDLGVDIPEGKKKFNKEERKRLVENIKMTTDDLNLENELQLQTITRLTNERYESYQMARAILKPLHEDKINKARKLAG